MRVIRIFPVLAILTATVLVASLFAFSAVGSVDARHLSDLGRVTEVTLFLERVDVVHTTDLAVKGEVIIVVDFESPMPVDLLKLQSGIFSALGLTDIDDGFVTQVRLVTTAASITFNGDTFPLSIPSGVLKLVGVFKVPDDTDAVFAFDLEKSVITTKDGVFKLKPVIKFASI